MTERIAFIDLDGVLCDFFGGVCRLFNRPDLVATWPAGEYRCHVALGLSHAEFWRTINTSPRFWIDLPPYPWAFSLLKAVAAAGYRPIILTCPNHDPTCAAQKTEWMHHHIACRHGPHRDYCITEHKELLAQPGRILIDDHDENCQAFAAAGGHSILFPQRWNSLHQVPDGYREVATELEQLREAFR